MNNIIGISWKRKITVNCWNHSFYCFIVFYWKFPVEIFNSEGYISSSDMNTRAQITYLYLAPCQFAIDCKKLAGFVQTKWLDNFVEKCLLCPEWRTYVSISTQTMNTFEDRRRKWKPIKECQMQLEIIIEEPKEMHNII